jgi:hypothetical protein
VKGFAQHSCGMALPFHWCQQWVWCLSQCIPGPPAASLTADWRTYHFRNAASCQPCRALLLCAGSMTSANQHTVLPQMNTRCGCGGMLIGGSGSGTSLGTGMQTSAGGSMLWSWCIITSTLLSPSFATLLDTRTLLLWCIQVAGM